MRDFMVHIADKVWPKGKRHGKVDYELEKKNF